MGSYQPDASEVTKLIQQAMDHPLGRNFLVEGALDSVAATFCVHAFVVDAARESLENAHSTAELKIERAYECTISK